MNVSRCGIPLSASRMKKLGLPELSQNRENIKQTRAQPVARALLTPSDAGQAAGIWGQQRKLPLNCFLSAQLQIIHAWLHHGGDGQFPWTAPTTGPALASSARDAGLGVDLTSCMVETTSSS